MNWYERAEQVLGIEGPYQGRGRFNRPQHPSSKRWLALWLCRNWVPGKPSYEDVAEWSGVSYGTVRDVCNRANGGVGYTGLSGELVGRFRAGEVMDPADVESAFMEIFG